MQTLITNQSLRHFSSTSESERKYMMMEKRVATWKNEREPLVAIHNISQQPSHIVACAEEEGKNQLKSGICSSDQRAMRFLARIWVTGVNPEPASVNLLSVARFRFQSSVFGHLLFFFHPDAAGRYACEEWLHRIITNLHNDTLMTFDNSHPASNEATNAEKLKTCEEQQG
jgi:hypothetical protein